MLLVILCMIACCAIMVGVWLWARPIQNAGVAHIFWAFNFAIIALIAYASAPGWLPRKSLLCTMVLFAGVRLGTYLGIRSMSRSEAEEDRYKQFRLNWSSLPDWQFFAFFQVHALTNIILALPFFLICANPQPFWSDFEIYGTVLWVIAFAGESMADYQLFIFKKDIRNKKKVCNTGLWAYSRHPNYFFEWLQWMAWFVFALGSPHGWLALASPLLMLWLLLKVTGIPVTEEHMLRSIGQPYRYYQRKVNAFIPGSKKEPGTTPPWHNMLLGKELLPDPLLRFRIRWMLRQRLQEKAKDGPEVRQLHLSALIQQLKSSPITINNARANGQQYELPNRFFRYCLGSQLKYSCGYWLPNTSPNDLDSAERTMLDLTCRRAELHDGQDILELGCGWGSLSLFMAQRYPNSRITAITNSQTAKEYIDGRVVLLGLTNLHVYITDMNDFEPPSDSFDRVVAVEMFEYMRNYQLLLKKIAMALRPDGKLFVHISTHKEYTYFSDDSMMPSDDLLFYFNDDLLVEEHWQIDGTHYAKTANAWLRRMDRNKSYVIPLFEKTYGEAEAGKWWLRWRLHYLSCAERWNYNQGKEWIISHYLFHKITQNAATKMTATANPTKAAIIAADS